jgi:hypothetical protein
MGIRVPTMIYQNVTHAATLTADSRAAAVLAKDNRDLSHARRILKTYFPAMPVDSLETILQHAFLKRSGRVGRATKQTDKRKAVLAVEAHIRHTHTPYEKLLQDGLDREEARNIVWDGVQQKKSEWAGTTPKTMEESASDIESISGIESLSDLMEGSPMDLD